MDQFCGSDRTVRNTGPRTSTFRLLSVMYRMAYSAILTLMSLGSFAILTCTVTPSLHRAARSIRAAAREATAER